MELPKLRNPAPEIERRIWKTLAEERAKEGLSTVLRLSQVGDCPRNLWAGLHGIAEDEPIEPRILAIFEHGKSIELHVIELLRKAGYMVLQQQAEIVLFDGRVVGHIDGTIMLGRRDKEDREGLLEIKSAKTSKFEELTTAGYEVWSPKYAAQIQCYMGFMKLPETLAVVYSKEDSRIYAERIKFDPQMFFRLRRIIESILHSKGLMPRPKEATSESCNYCRYCPRNAWCWASTTGVEFDV